MWPAVRTRSLASASATASKTGCEACSSRANAPSEANTHNLPSLEQTVDGPETEGAAVAANLFIGRAESEASRDWPTLKSMTPPLNKPAQRWPPPTASEVTLGREDIDLIWLASSRPTTPKSVATATSPFVPGNGFSAIAVTCGEGSPSFGPICSI